MPERYLLGDRALYMQAVKNSLAAYSRTGVIEQAGMESTYAMLRQFEKSLQNVKVDLGTTFIDTFAKQAQQMVR